MAFPTLEAVPIGARLDVPAWAGALLEHEVWFAEYGGFIVEISDDAAFSALAVAYDVPSPVIGATIAAAVIDLAEPHEIVALADVREAWARPLRDFYGSAA
jgi:hypothetical protein